MSILVVVVVEDVMVVMIQCEFMRNRIMRWMQGKRDGMVD